MSRFYARHGGVVQFPADAQWLSRKEAIQLALELARAIQMADDMSDPFAVELVELLAKKVEKDK